MDNYSQIIVIAIAIHQIQKGMAAIRAAIPF
jgi:hypothetical protein